MEIFNSVWDIFIMIISSIMGGAVIGGIVFAPIMIIKKQEKPPKYIIFIIAIVAIFVFLYLGAKEWYGNHQVGSFLECDNYEDELYYANLFEDKDGVKNYRVVVELDRLEGHYSVDNIYFNETQYLQIYDSENYILLEEKYYFKDQEGKEWYLELTDKKAKAIPNK